MPEEDAEEYRDHDEHERQAPEEVEHSGRQEQSACLSERPRRTPFVWTLGSLVPLPARREHV